MTHFRIRQGIVFFLGLVLLGGTVVLAAPGRTANQTEVIRFLFQLPPEGGEVVLSDGQVERSFPSRGGYAVLEAPPGEYCLHCGERSAMLRLTDVPEVLGGDASWDGELLHMDRSGTLELICQVYPGRQMEIAVSAVDGVYHRAAAYDSALQGEPVLFRMSLPAGPVTVLSGSFCQSLTLRPGETATVYLN